METTVMEDTFIWVGFLMALWALAMATLLLSLLRAKTNSSAIYTNQALCLLLAESLYLIAFKSRTTLAANEVSCVIISV